MPAAWSAYTASWLCSGCSSANWANKHSCRWCSTKKTYADVTKLGPKKPPATTSPAATLTTAAPPTTTPPTAASATTTLVNIKLKLSALQAAKLATEAAELPTTAIDQQIADVTRQLHAAKPAGVQLDSLRAAIARADKRLAKAMHDKDDAQARIKVETEASAKLHDDMITLEATMTTTAPVNGLPPGVATQLSDAIQSLRSGTVIQQEDLAIFLEKLIVTQPLNQPPTIDMKEQGDELSDMDETSAENAWGGPGTGEEASEPTPWHEDEEDPTPAPWHAGLTPVGKTAWMPSAPTHLSSPARRARGKNYVETPQLAQGA
jgi:hypothetical protein